MVAVIWLVRIVLIIYSELFPPWFSVMLAACVSIVSRKQAGRHAKNYILFPQP